MSTDNQNNQPNTPVPAPQVPQSANPAPANNDSGQALADLADTLSSVDQNAPDAQANATSISDNNGGRIELNQDKIDNRANTPVIKK